LKLLICQESVSTFPNRTIRVFKNRQAFINHTVPTIIISRNFGAPCLQFGINILGNVIGNFLQNICFTNRSFNSRLLFLKNLCYLHGWYNFVSRFILFIFKEFILYRFTIWIWMNEYCLFLVKKTDGVYLYLKWRWVHW